MVMRAGPRGRLGHGGKDAREAADDVKQIGPGKRKGRWSFTQPAGPRHRRCRSPSRPGNYQP